MDFDKVKYVANLLGTNSVKTPNSSGWASISCPLAPWTHEKGTDHSRGFGIAVNPHGESQMHCFSCQFSGTLISLVQDLKFRKADVDIKALMALAVEELDGGGLTIFEDDNAAQKGLHAFPEAWLDSFPSALESGQALMYLRTRNGGPVPDQVIKALDIRWDAFRKRVCFPVRGADHRLYGFHGRTIEPHQELRYMMYTNPKGGGTNPEVWFGEHFIDWDKPVVIAESMFDAARVYQIYRNVLTPYKAGLSDAMLERIKSLFEIVTLFDPDKAGDKARVRITTWAKYSSKVQRIIRHAPLPKGFDGGDMPVDALADVLSPFITLDPTIGG